MTNEPIKLLIDDALRELYERLKYSNEDDLPKEFLENIIDALKIIKSEIDKNRFSNYDPAIKYMIRDSWPLDDPLGLKLLEIERLYTNLKTKNLGEFPEKFYEGR